MAIIKSFLGRDVIFLELDFLNSEGYIYSPMQPDYMNWIPCKVEITTKTEKCSFFELPTLSIEGIKVLFSKFDELFDNRNEVANGMEFINGNNKEFSYRATEGEFDINFQNIIDKQDLVEISIWMHIAFCHEDLNYYWKGYRFSVGLNELKIFVKELKHKLYVLTDGNEGEKMQTE